MQYDFNRFLKLLRIFFSLDLYNLGHFYPFSTFHYSIFVRVGQHIELWQVQRDKFGNVGNADIVQSYRKPYKTQTHSVTSFE